MPEQPSDTGTAHQGRWTALILLIASMGLLLPGILADVITIRGSIQPEGVAQIAPQMLDKGLSDEALGTLRTMLNPIVVRLAESSEGGLRKALLEQLTPQLVASFNKSGEPMEVYSQSRSILGSISHLFEVGSPIPALLILVFSIVVPFGKGMMVLQAAFDRNAARRTKTLRFVESIGKWSMADVFVVALFIAFLAAQASQSPTGPGLPPPIVAFTAHFGPGFYWFAAYCIVSLMTQQWTAKALAEKPVATPE